MFAVGCNESINFSSENRLGNYAQVVIIIIGLYSKNWEILMEIKEFASAVCL